MTILSCERVNAKLAAFVDGELRGEQVLSVANHLDSCASCADDAQALRDVGDLLRGAAASVVVPAADLAGLTDGVISRVQAEARQSWTATCSRALDDLHWIVVGAGALAAAALSLTIVCGLFEFSVPGREDSRAALLRTVGPALGDLPGGAEGGVVFAVGLGNAGSRLVQSVNELAGVDVQTWAGDMSRDLVTDDGFVRDLQAHHLSKASQMDVEAVVGELSRFSRLNARSGTASGVWLMSTVHVKAL